MGDGDGTEAVGCEGIGREGVDADGLGTVGVGIATVCEVVGVTETSGRSAEAGFDVPQAANVITAGTIKIAQAERLTGPSGQVG